MASALLSLFSLDCVFAAPASVSTANASHSDTAVAGTAGPGWTAVDQLIQTFELSAATASSAASLSASSSSSSSSTSSSSSLPTSKKSSGQGKKTKVGKSAGSLIDYQEMSVRCLGKKDWDALSPSQRSQFVASLRGLVEQRYYPRWRKIFGKGKVTFQDETTQRGDILVRTKLMLGKKEELLSWRVVGQSGTPKIVSLSVSNSDLLERLKSRIKARQQKVGFDALLAWMKGHSNEDMAISNSGVSTSAVSGISSNSAVNSSPATVLPIAAVRASSLSAGAAASISD